MSLNFNFLMEEVSTGEKLVYLDWLFSGLEITLTISLLGFIFSFLIGISLGILANSDGNKRKITNLWLDIITSIPFIVVVFISYFLLPQVLLKDVSQWNNNVIMYTTGLFSLSICMGSRIAVNIANGLKEFKKQSRLQIKAAKSFGLSKWSIYKDIVLPQVFNKVKPSLRNDVVTIVKNSSVVGTIGLLEFNNQAQSILNDQANPNEIFIILIVGYILLSVISIGFFNIVFKMVFKR